MKIMKFKVYSNLCMRQESGYILILTESLRTLIIKILYN